MYKLQYNNVSPTAGQRPGDPSLPDCLAADDASDLQLARPVLLQYSPFIFLPLLVLQPLGIASCQCCRH